MGAGTVWSHEGGTAAYQAKVVVSDAELELAHGLHERRALNVADSAAELRGGAARHGTARARV